MKIALYARVSSESQAKEGTIQSQLEALREYSKSHKLTIIEECLDDGFSGADLNRPGLDHLRDLAQEGQIEAVLVLSPDRLSRRQAHQIILLEEFQKRNLQVIFTSQLTGDTPEDNLLLQIQGAVSEYERAKIIDRTRRGTKHAVTNGQVIGANAPYGYRFVAKSNLAPAHYEIDPQEAALVRLIFDLYANKGMKAPTIAKYLEAQGIPSRSSYSKWWESSIYAILKNETYTGTAYMFKTKSTEPHEGPKLARYRRRKNSSKADRPREDWIGIPVTPIIDAATWEKTQQGLKLNSIGSKRNNSKTEYLLRGLVVCGLCGSMAPGHVSNHKTYYSCGAKRNGNITTKPHAESISARHADLDAKVWEGLTELLSHPAQLKAQLAKRLEAKQTAPSSPKQDAPDKDLQRLDVQEQRLIDAYREGILSLPELKEQKTKLAAKRKVLEARKNALARPQERAGRAAITLTELGAVSARYRRAMAKADFGTKQKLVRLLVNSVTLHPRKAIVQGNIPLAPDALVPSHHAAPLPLAPRSGGHGRAAIQSPAGHATPKSHAHGLA